MSCHGVGEGGYKLCYDNYVPDYGENGHGFSKITNEGSDSRPFLLNPLIRKLSNHTDLSASDRDALERLVQRSQHVAARTDLVQEGDPTGSLYLILTGWACRYKGLPNGERQIIAYFIPGDLCDQRMFILKQMDHSIGTITSATVAVIPAENMIDITDQHPRIARALWWSTLVDEAITREWVVNVGQRNALERVAHLICEMYLRVQAVGLSEGTRFDFPVTQTELADTVGLTLVHTNRMLRDLRAAGLISWKGKRLTILDVERLANLSMFNSNYLHLEHEENGSKEFRQYIPGP
jgi:CRP-like cAMP-binding protein